MRANIEVTSRHEGNAIRAGLDDPKVRAVVVIMGALAPLANDKIRKRVLQFVRDQLDDEPSLALDGKAEGQ